MKPKIAVAMPGQRGSGKLASATMARVLEGRSQMPQQQQWHDDVLDSMVSSGESMICWDWAVEPFQWVYSTRKGGHIRHGRQRAYGYYETVYCYSASPRVYIGTFDDPPVKGAWRSRVENGAWKACPEAEVPAVVRMALMLAQS